MEDSRLVTPTPGMEPAALAARARQSEGSVMTTAIAAPDVTLGIHRTRLFAGICLALIPTGASFALVSNILVPLKQEFILTNYQVGLIGGAALWGMAISLLVMGPLLETFGLRNGARMAFAGHLTGITLMIAASWRAGDPSAFWMLMAGAATLAAGNGMIEVTGNPLVAALYPDQKTTRLNWFHAFFPIGIVLGGIAGFLMANYGGTFGRWPRHSFAICRQVPRCAPGVMSQSSSSPHIDSGRHVPSAHVSGIREPSSVQERAPSGSQLSPSVAMVGPGGSIPASWLPTGSEGSSDAPRVAS